MVNGENSAILLFLKYNVLLTSTLSVFSYQFGLLLRKIRFPLLTIDHSPPQPAGCVTATPLLLLLFNPDCFGIKFRLRRNRNKRGGLCSYWFKFEQGDKDPNWYFDAWCRCWSFDQHVLKLWMVNGELWMVKVRPSCCFYTIKLIHSAHYQLSVFNYPFIIAHSPIHFAAFFG